MKTLMLFSHILCCVGAINWGLVAFLKFNLESELKYSEFVSIANENILSFQNKEEFLKLFGDEKITNLRLGYSTFSSDLTLRKALDMKE